MQEKTHVAVVIPALNPDDKLLQLVDDLLTAGLEDIVVVNDGSAPEYAPIFEKVAQQRCCRVLTHAVNQGKGRAMKTAFHELLNCGEAQVAVTVDADGQHRINDILAVAHETAEHSDSLVFGCRDFSSKTAGIPARSRFGNVLTSRLLKLLCGITLSDTQTGLRGFSPTAMRLFLSTAGERYEFEMNMILDAKEHGIPLREVPIETVYIDGNESSHFNPLTDSLRIYAVFGKFIMASLSSFAVDILMYTLLLGLITGVFAPDLLQEKAIIVATYAARVVSSLYNFTVNRRAVFKSHAPTGGCLVRYVVLMLAQVTASAFATSALFAVTDWGATFWKLVVDLILFLVSFRIQRGWVFRQ